MFHPNLKLRDSTILRRAIALPVPGVVYQVPGVGLFSAGKGWGILLGPGGRSFGGRADGGPCDASCDETGSIPLVLCNFCIDKGLAPDNPPNRFCGTPPYELK